MKSTKQPSPSGAVMCSIRNRPLLLLTPLYRRVVLSLTTKSPQRGELQYAGISSHRSLTAPHVLMRCFIQHRGRALQESPLSTFFFVSSLFLTSLSTLSPSRTPVKGLTVTQAQPGVLHCFWNSACASLANAAPFGLHGVRSVASSIVMSLYVP